MLVTYVDRCPTCACTTLRDEGSSRPLPDSVGCGRSCRCHSPQYGVRATQAGLAADAARFRFWRRGRGLDEGVAAVR